MLEIKGLKNKMISDKELSDKWDASQIKAVISNPHEGMEYHCSEGAFEFKQGQWVKIK